MNRARPLGRLWPIHLKPLPDELLSSWLMRISRAYGVNPHTFCQIVWPGEYIWNRDIDHLASFPIVEILAQKSGVSIQRAWQTTLPAYEGVVFEVLTRNGHTPWLLPLGIWHRQHLRYGLQFCPGCLAEDDTPYYRRSWRLAFVTCCIRHRTALLDRCPHCGLPVNFFYNKSGRSTITLCSGCDLDFRKLFNRTNAASSLEIRCQRSIQYVLARGWTSVGNYKGIYSLLYFEGLRLVCKFLLNPSNHGYIAVLLNENLSNILPRTINQHRILELHDVVTRRLVVMSAWSLLFNWPSRIGHFARDNHISASDVLRDAKHVPFWFYQGIHDQLDKSTPRITEKEIVESTSYLNKLGLPLTARNVFGLLGHKPPSDAGLKIRRALKGRAYIHH